MKHITCIGVPGRTSAFPEKPQVSERATNRILERLELSTSGLSSCPPDVRVCQCVLPGHPLPYFCKC